jgi:Zn-dependent protease
MKTSFKLFNFLGAPVEISVWFFLIFLFLNVKIILALFISILVHEMAHAFVAHRLGWGFYGIKLDLFFGTANVDMSMPERDSIRVVAAGPISNLLLAGVTFLGYSLAVSSNLGINQQVGSFLNSLFTINMILFIFNLLPIFPMDGGRLVRDILITRLRSRLKARRISATISLIASALLLLYAVSISAIFLIVFSVFFIWIAYKDLQELK